MYKILLVEDELLTRVGIRCFYPWESDGFMICGEAANGKEALEKFDKLQPDVVFTDIIMPVMDGFDLIKEIKKRNRKVCCIVLSCLEEAENVRKMLTLGASGYFFKNSMAKEDLHELLVRIREDLKEQPPYAGSNSFKQRNYEGFDGFLCVSLDKVMQKDTIVFNNHLKDFIQNYIQRHVRQSETICLRERLFFIGLVGRKDNLISIEKISDSLSENIMIYFNTNPHICGYRVNGADNVIKDDGMLSRCALDYIESRQTDAAVQAVFMLLKVCKDKSLDETKKHAIRLLYACKGILDSEDIPRNVCAGWDFITAAIGAPDIIVLSSILYSVIALVVGSAESAGGVDAVKQYLRSNYQRDITLEDAARIAGMNSSYFSRVFKKDTGLSFVRYLTNLRLERVKELLSGDADLTIGEIADSVGFESANYLSAVFKKWYGVSPTEYRQRGE